VAYGVARSQRLIAWNSNGPGSSPRFVCPDGYTTLVKSAHCYNSGATAVTVQLVPTFITENVSVYLFSQLIEPNTEFSWTGWAVLHPGDSVFLYVTDLVVTCSLHGAVLAGPPQFPPATREAPQQLPDTLPPRPQPRQYIPSWFRRSR
jgi:hypothetical protein